jgi:hypothetical protein
MGLSDQSEITYTKRPGKSRAAEEKSKSRLIVSDLSVAVEAGRFKRSRNVDDSVSVQLCF